MTWVRVADTFPDHRKVVDAGYQAAWLYVTMLCHSSRNLTDGFVPTGVLGRLSDLPQPRKHVDRLVTVGLIEQVEGGWQIVNYDQWQRTREEVEAERQATRERVRKHREKRQSNGVSNTVSNGAVTKPDTETDTDNPPLPPPGGDEGCADCGGKGIIEYDLEPGTFVDCPCKLERKRQRRA